MNTRDNRRGTGAAGAEVSPAPQRDRRSVLRAGAIGAAWVVPAVTMIGVSPAHADNPSGPVVTTPPTVTPPTTQPPSVENETKTPPATQPPAGTPAGTQAAPVRVEAAQATPVAAAPQSLAFTGADTGVAAAVAAGLVIGGAALTATSRKGKEQGGKHSA